MMRNCHLSFESSDQHVVLFLTILALIKDVSLKDGLFALFSV